jgi:hypothetical protein
MKSILYLTISTFFFVTNINSQSVPKFKQQILISAAGQSADTKLVGMVIKKLNLDVKENNNAKPNDLNGIKTLIIVPGFSSKGLGAAGISQEQEMNRVKELITAANQKNIPIICIHIGGNARRKGQSDDFNKYVSENSKYLIIVKQGDEDKFFTNIASQNKIPIKLVEKISEISNPLAAIFE